MKICYWRSPIQVLDVTSFFPFCFVWFIITFRPTLEKYFASATCCIPSLVRQLRHVYLNPLNTFLTLLYCKLFFYFLKFSNKMDLQAHKYVMQGYVCFSICMHVCQYLCIYLYMCLSVYVCMHVFVYMCMCFYMCRYLYM